MKYATRVNSYLRTGLSVEEALRTIGTIEGLDYVDLNYPEHFKFNSVEEIGGILQESGLELNAINLRFRNEYLYGIFDNKDIRIRNQAVDLCRSAADVCKKLNGLQCIIWLGFDGFEYSFQKDYVKSWKRLVKCFQDVCDSTDIRISIEYKPYEERTFALVDSWGSAWKLVHDVDRPNFGVTLDMCHMLMKKENPAQAAAILLSEGKLTGIHVNDGEGSFDDGLIVGSVHPFKTLELFYYLIKYNYSDVVYFDTFPKREDAVGETVANLKACHAFERIIQNAGIGKIEEVLEQEDGLSAMDFLFTSFLGGANE